MKNRFALALALFAGITVAAAWVVSRGRPSSESAVQPQGGEDLLPAAVPPSPAVFDRAGSPTGGVTEKGDELKKRFGRDLMITFSGGRLASVRGGPGFGARAGAGFRIDDRRRVVARAREIVEAAAGLLGLRPDFPLGDPALNQSAVSAQVFFEQTHHGIPLAPRGAVTVDLGPQGELLGLYSDYVPDVSVSVDPGGSRADEEKITAEQARIRAGVGYREQAEGGRQVYWLLGISPSARLAYEFIVEGNRVVVDAGTGAVLSRRDRRHQ